MRTLKLLILLCFACSTSSRTDAGGVDAAGMDASSSDDVSTTADAAALDAGPNMDSGAAQDTAPGADAGLGSDAGGNDAGGLAECSADNLCEGACTGRSCSATWFCVADAPCTDDIATFCGCDGTTFSGSSTCPSRPFASMGPCPTREGINCDPRDVACDVPAPECEPGSVPEVNESGDCWTTRCVAIGECGCTSPEECPDPDNYTCRNDTGRCTPFL